MDLSISKRFPSVQLVPGLWHPRCKFFLVFTWNSQLQFLSIVPCHVTRHHKDAVCHYEYNHITAHTYSSAAPL